MRVSYATKRKRPAKESESAEGGCGQNNFEQRTEDAITSQGDQQSSRRVWNQCRRVSPRSLPLPIHQVQNSSLYPTSPMELPHPTLCHHCLAKKFAFETKHFCCDDGQVHATTNEWPSELKRLYTSNEEDALHFQKYARVYNNLFAFSSIAGGIKADTKKGASSGQRKRNSMISCRDYYAYMFQIRPNNYILRTCRLLQQFIVDMYVKIENTRLDFFRQNQKLIRAELYQGIIDSLAHGERDANNIGHRMVLPPTFIGGPRDMKRRYLNAMALVRRYGKPDIFLTMTCNPKWKEIQAELSLGEKAENRPDLLARIFRAKLMMMKKKNYG